MYLGFLVGYFLFPGSKTVRGGLECCQVVFDCSREPLQGMMVASMGWQMRSINHEDGVEKGGADDADGFAVPSMDSDFEPISNPNRSVKRRDRDCICLILEIEHAPHARGRLGSSPEAYARGRQCTPHFRSNLPGHDEIQIPDRYMPQADVSEAETQKQAMGNDSVGTREIFLVYMLGKFLV